MPGTAILRRTPKTPYLADRTSTGSFAVLLTIGASGIDEWFPAALARRNRS
jgi:hypothetical protein